MYYNLYHSQKSKDLSEYNFKKTYFFTEYEDFIAPVILSKKNINEIILIDNHSQLFSKRKNKISLKDHLKKILIKILQANINVKINFHSFKYSKKNSTTNQFPRYVLNKKKINQISPKKINNKFDLHSKLDDKILKKYYVYRL